MENNDGVLLQVNMNINDPIYIFHFFVSYAPWSRWRLHCPRLDWTCNNLSRKYALKSRVFVSSNLTLPNNGCDYTGFFGLLHVFVYFQDELTYQVLACTKNDLIFLPGTHW